MEIKVIGAGCKECDTLYQNVKEAVKELGKDAKIEKVEELIEIVKLGVLSAPSLMIDGETGRKRTGSRSRRIKKAIVLKEA